MKWNPDSFGTEGVVFFIFTTKFQNNSYFRGLSEFLTSTIMQSRRNFLQWSTFSLPFLSAVKVFAKPTKVSEFSETAFRRTGNKPIVVSTWDSGLPVNAVAWKTLKKPDGRALDAVEAGANSIEDTINCCVGLGGNPDRDGKVTLDASIMDDKANCG